MKLMKIYRNLGTMQFTSRINITNLLTPPLREERYLIAIHS
jgi:hypothetical protein